MCLIQLTVVFLLSAATSEKQFKRRWVDPKKGKGAYASVYLAECIDVSDQNPVQLLACKVIDPRKVSKDYEKKFLPRELDILRKVNHPHIVHLHAIYRSGPRIYVFMRYAENSDLLNFIIKTGEVVENQARLWVKQMSLAIQYLHELEIAHRDLKCENILVTANYNVKLTDMGFARFLLNKHGHRVHSETYCGSTSYAPPEILKKVPYDPKAADIWSLGVIIYVMLNKALPFLDTTLKTLYMQQVKDLLQKLLEPNPDHRFTIEQVLDSEWLHMDTRILGMTEEEKFALFSAKEERRNIHH